MARGTRLLIERCTFGGRCCLGDVFSTRARRHCNHGYGCHDSGPEPARAAGDRSWLHVGTVAPSGGFDLGPTARAKAGPVKETTMVNYSRWDDSKKQRPAVAAETSTGME